MNLLKTRLWAAIALGMMSGSALAAPVDCTVTPEHSIVVEGDSLTMQAVCDGALNSIEWNMDGVSVTGVVPAPGHTANKPIFFTTPVGLGGANSYLFTVTGTPTDVNDSFRLSTSARVTVKPSSAVVAKAAGASTPMSPIPAECGTPLGAVVQGMPTAQCSAGKPALAVSGPQSFTWSCMSPNGGAEANCYALRGFTVSATVVGGNGSVGISPVGGGVVAGGTATITARPVDGFSASFTTGTTCPGYASGNQFTAGPITETCTVNATFTNVPQAAVCGQANGLASLTIPTTDLCSTGTLLGNVVSGAGQFTWTCDGPNGGTDASCSAPKQYKVSATISGAGGNINNAPISNTVVHNGSTSFTVTPDATNVASAVGDNCAASVSGNTVNVSAVTGTCVVSVSFAAASSCVLPANTKVYTTAAPEPFVANLDTIFDLATTAVSLDSLVNPSQIKSYEFSNDKAFRNGSIYNFYSTGSKDVSISACPGDFNVPAECVKLAAKSPRVYWSKDGLPVPDPTFTFLTYQTCNIGTGAKVYLNIRGLTTSVSYQIRNEVMNR